MVWDRAAEAASVRGLAFGSPNQARGSGNSRHPLPPAEISANVAHQFADVLSKRRLGDWDTQSLCLQGSAVGFDGLGLTGMIDKAGQKSRIKLGKQLTRWAGLVP